MPELAEVEFYRHQWDRGLGKRILRVSLHQDNRVFRGANISDFERLVSGSVLRSSEARGKQMLFRFSRRIWLGLHLGMTGTLRIEQASFDPGRHDHLVLCQTDRALVFRDPRQFGRVRFHHGATAPEWWRNLPPAVTSPAFTTKRMTDFLMKHGRLPIKAALLLQGGFPGVGNWMADEILWRAQLNPLQPSGTIDRERMRTLWRKTRWVGREAMKHISLDFSDPPRAWFYHERWIAGGRCPLDHAELRRETVGGRTTAWCPRCQKRPHD